MTEKRFTFIHDSVALNLKTPICDNGQSLTLGEVLDKMNELSKENEQLKQELFETSKELLWATSDEVDRALYYEEEVEELRKEIFE